MSFRNSPLTDNNRANTHDATQYRHDRIDFILDTSTAYSCIVNQIAKQYFDHETLHGYVGKN